MLFWRHIDPDPAEIGPAALQTARGNLWSTLPAEAQARHLRAFLVMTLQAATLRADPQPLGLLSPAAYPDDERNAYGAAVARTLLYLTPERSTVITQSIQTTAGFPAIHADDPGTGFPPLAIVALAIVAAAAAAYIASAVSEVIDSVNFRNNQTARLMSTHATVLEVLTRHADREKLAGQLLPYTDEEKQLLASLEHAQEQIATARRQPLASPFSGAKVLADLAHGAGETLSALTPLVLIGGALYLFAGGRERLSASHDTNPTHEDGHHV